jgi:hypothetical protein
MMHCNLSCGISEVVLASDAMGASELDHGGFGLVATDASSEEIAAMMSSSEHLGRAIARLDGDLSGLRDPNKAIRPTILFSLLPRSLFEQSRWLPVNAGRWSHADHITLGESRGVRKLAEACSMIPICHNKVVFALQDNMACAGSMNKGRSCAWALNRAIRRKSALALACCLRFVMPWVETALMPADELSRIPGCL